MNNFFRYFQYLPILIQLVELIRKAQASFSNGSNAAKLQWVQSQFISLVGLAESTGLLKSRLADALRSGSAAIISIVVQAMNSTEGGISTDGVVPEDVS